MAFCLCCASLHRSLKIYTLRVTVLIILQILFLELLTAGRRLIQVNPGSRAEMLEGEKSSSTLQDLFYFVFHALIFVIFMFVKEHCWFGLSPNSVIQTRCV